MQTIRRSEDRGHADHGWLKAKHSFSFSNYYDDRFLGFRDLRVINEDQVEGGGGFPTHGHKNMEIITYILEGSLEHKDSMGTGSVIKPGDVQYMSAGTGVMHSEFNHSKVEKVHLLQIWILPAHQGATPAYDQKFYSVEKRLNQLALIASESGGEGAIKIRQDAKIYASILESGKALELSLDPKRYAWVQVARGEIEVNGEVLKAGDGLSLSNERSLKILGKDRAEFLIFDLN